MKRNIAPKAALLASAIATFVSTANAVQATTNSVVAGTDDPNVLDGAFHEMRKQLEPINSAAMAIISAVKNDKDPVSLDNFDIDKVGAEFKASGLLVDMDTWRGGAELIQQKGFVRYLEELQQQTSKMDLTLANIETEVTAWAKMDADDRSTDAAAITIVPALAKLVVSATVLQNFGLSGVLTLTKLTELDAQMADKAKNAEPAAA